MTRSWSYIVAVYVPPGVPHKAWAEPLGKQRVGERYSCIGFLHVVRAVSLRQWDDQSSIGHYYWDETAGLWRLSSSVDCSNGDSTVVPKQLCPETLPGDIEIIDCGGPEWSPEYLPEVARR